MAEISNNEPSSSCKDIDFDEPSNGTVGRWTREEHLNFIKGLELHGKGWKKIAALIKTRTVVQIRTHAQKYFLKLQKARNESNGKVQNESKMKDGSRKIKSKRPEIDHSNTTFSRPQVIFQNKDNVEASLYNFLTPNYPVDFNIEACDLFQKGAGVEELVRNAESLDWAQDAQFVEAATAKSYQHVSPRGFVNTEYSGAVKTEPQQQHTYTTTTVSVHHQHLSGHTIDCSSSMAAYLYQSQAALNSCFNYNDLDALAFPVVHGDMMHNSDDSDQWAKHAAAHAFFGNDCLSSEEDIGLYFQD